MAENTIIVYSADNGYFMGNRGLAGKWSHFDEALRVPLIVYDPRVAEEQRGKVVDAIALNLDLPATFLDWAGIEVPERYQGRSLQPLVTNAVPENWRRESFHEHFAVRHRIPAFEGVRNQDFKYVRYIDEGEHEFLHDLRRDPNELVNLAGDPAHQETLVAMRQRTDERVRELGGPLSSPQTAFSTSTVPHPEASANVGAQLDQDGFVSLFDGKKSAATGPATCSTGRCRMVPSPAQPDGKLKANSFLTWKDSTVRNFDLRGEGQS